MPTPFNIPDTKRLAFLLGWNAAEDSVQDKKPGLWDTLRGYVSSPAMDETPLTQIHDDDRDLDIGCYVFDADKTLLEVVMPGLGHDINESESIYHTGDEETGRSSDNFDEELYIDLARLPINAQTILIYVRVDSDVDITPDAAVKFRIMNSTDGKVLLDQALSFDKENEKGHLLGRLTRAADHWIYIPINVYTFTHPEGRESDVFTAYL
jgi:stress response protein SCP2